jgi:hypothetical protein
VEKAPPGYVPMIEATKLLGVTRQTVLQRVKRGELDAGTSASDAEKAYESRYRTSPSTSSEPRQSTGGQSDEQSKNLAKSKSTTV